MNSLDIVDLPLLEQQVSEDIANAQTSVEEFWQWLTSTNCDSLEVL